MSELTQECTYCTEPATVSCPLCYMGYCESCLKEHIELYNDRIVLCPQQQLDLEIINSSLVKHLEGVCKNFVEGTIPGNVCENPIETINLEFSDTNDFIGDNLE